MRSLLLLPLLTFLLLLPSVQAQESNGTFLGYLSEFDEHYINPDGTYKVKRYGVPIVYNDSGTWKVINTSFMPSSLGFKVRGYFDVELTSSLTKDAGDIILTKGDVQLTHVPKSIYLQSDPTNALKVQGTINAVKDANIITYPSIFGSGTSLRYTYSSFQLKQDLILQSSPYPSAPTGDYFVLKERVTTTAPRWNESTDKRVRFKDSRDDDVFFFERPFAFDSAGARIDLEFKVSYEAGTWYYKTLVPTDWLNAPERVYPVTIDPTTSGTVVFTDYMELGNPGSSGNNNDFSQGAWAGNTSKIRRNIMQGTLPNLEGSITTAQIEIYKTGQQGSHSFNNELHNLTKTPTTAVTWNTYDGTNAWATAGGDYEATIIDSVARTATLEETHIYCFVGACATNPVTITWGDTFNFVWINSSIDTQSLNYEVYGGSGDANATRLPVITITYVGLPTYSSFTKNPDPVNEDQDITVGLTVNYGGGSLSSGTIQMDNVTDLTNHSVTLVAGEVQTFLYKKGNYTAHDNNTYQWLFCNEAGCSWSQAKDFVVANQAPGAPSSINATSGHSLTPHLGFTVGTDADAEDTVTSSISIDSTAYSSTGDTYQNHNFAGSLATPTGLSYDGASKTFYVRMWSRDGTTNSTNYQFTYAVTNAQPGAPSAADLAGGVTSDTTPAISFTKGTDSDTAPTDTVTQYISIDSTAYKEAGDSYTSNGDVSSFTVSPALSAGKYYASMWAGDDTGASNNKSAYYNFTFTIEAINLTFSRSGDTLSLKINGTATYLSNGTGLTNGTTVNFSVAGVAVQNTTYNNGNFTYTFSNPALNAGSNVVEVNTTDGTITNSTETQSFSLSASYVSTTLSTSNDADNDGIKDITLGNSITITTTFNNNGGIAWGTDVLHRISVAGTDQRNNLSAAVAAGAQSSDSATVTPSIAGTYTITTDILGSSLAETTVSNAFEVLESANPPEPRPPDDPGGGGGSGSGGSGDGYVIPDADSDGIADANDKCPTTPGVVKYDGCPSPVSEAEARGAGVTLAGDNPARIMVLRFPGELDVLEEGSFTALIYESDGISKVRWSSSLDGELHVGVPGERKVLVSSKFTATLTPGLHEVCIEVHDAKGRITEECSNTQVGPVKEEITRVTEPSVPIIPVSLPEAGVKARIGGIGDRIKGFLSGLLSKFRGGAPSLPSTPGIPNLPPVQAYPSGAPDGVPSGQPMANSTAATGPPVEKRGWIEKLKGLI